MKVWQCKICKYIYKGEFPPDKCPVCNAAAKYFKEIVEEILPPKKSEITKKKEPSEAVPVSKSPPPEPEKGFEKIKSLLIKHHAHPIAVHTPNGLLPAAFVLWFLSWVSGSDLLAKAALINQIFVLLSFPFVIFTGVLEWQIKYKQALTPVFKLKIAAASLTGVTSLVSLIWFLFDNQVLTTTRAWGFMLITFIMLLSAGTAGHIGGKLVFKD